MHADTGLQMISGGGEGRPPCPVCPVCGAAHWNACGVLARYRKHLEMRGLRSGAARERALWRTARAIAPVPLLDASRADLLKWRESLTVSDGTVLTYLSAVRSFFAWARDEGLVEDDPAVRIPAPRRPARLPHPIGESDLMRALDAAPDRIRLWLVLEAWAGLRACEVAGLRRESIAETASPPYLIVSAESSKSGRARRIPLSPFVVDEIRAAALPATGFAFPRRDGKPGPLAPHVISHVVGRHLARHGIPGSGHGLRHRAATQAWRATRDLLAVRDLLGHASVATTQIYTLVDSQAVADAVNAIPAPPRLRLVTGQGAS